MGPAVQLEGLGIRVPVPGVQALARVEAGPVPAQQHGAARLGGVDHHEAGLPVQPQELGVIGPQQPPWSQGLQRGQAQVGAGPGPQLRASPQAGGQHKEARAQHQRLAGHHRGRCGEAGSRAPVRRAGQATWQAGGWEWAYQTALPPAGSAAGCSPRSGSGSGRQRAVPGRRGAPLGRRKPLRPALTRRPSGTRTALGGGAAGRGESQAGQGHPTGPHH